MKLHLFYKEHTELSHYPNSHHSKKNVLFSIFMKRVVHHKIGAITDKKLNPQYIETLIEENFNHPSQEPKLANIINMDATTHSHQAKGKD